MTQTNDEPNRNPSGLLVTRKRHFLSQLLSSKLGTSFPTRRRPFFFHYCQRLLSRPRQSDICPQLFLLLFCRETWSFASHFIFALSASTATTIILFTPNPLVRLVLRTDHTCSSTSFRVRFLLWTVRIGKKQGERPGCFLKGWATGEKTTTTGLVMAALAGDSPPSFPASSLTPSNTPLQTASAKLECFDWTGHDEPQPPTRAHPALLWEQRPRNNKKGHWRHQPGMDASQVSEEDETRKVGGPTEAVSGAVLPSSTRIGAGSRSAVKRMDGPVFPFYSATEMK
jgi:hypothetical protein